MSQKEGVLTKGNQNNVVSDIVFTRELFDSATSTSSSYNGSTTTTTTSTGGSSCSSSSLECSTSCLSSPLALPCAADSCKLEPPLKLQYADICNLLSPPLMLQSPLELSPSSTLSALRYPRKLEHENGAVKRSMGLMKLRRQGSHPPAPRSHKTCHGSFNQAAAARELMASLERLSMKEKTIGKNEQLREREAQRALLGGESEETESSRNGIMKAPELPLTAKIAAAMDAEGLIGVQEEISLQCIKYKSRVLRSFNSDQYPPPSFKTCKSRKQLRLAAAGRSGDREMRPVAARKMHSALPKRRSTWIILRRLRSTRALLGKIWRKFKRVFSSSSRKNLQRDLLKVKSLKD